MIFIAAASVVVTTAVVVSVAVVARFTELLTPHSCGGDKKTDAHAEDDAAPPSGSKAGHTCTAHLLHLYQSA
jgi:hypothetical protein